MALRAAPRFAEFRKLRSLKKVFPPFRSGIVFVSLAGGDLSGRSCEAEMKLMIAAFTLLLMSGISLADSSRHAIQN